MCLILETGSRRGGGMRGKIFLLRFGEKEVAKQQQIYMMTEFIIFFKALCRTWKEAGKVTGGGTILVATIKAAVGSTSSALTYLCNS